MFPIVYLSTSMGQYRSKKSKEEALVPPAITLTHSLIHLHTPNAVTCSRQGNNGTRGATEDKVGDAPDAGERINRTI